MATQINLITRVNLRIQISVRFYTFPARVSLSPDSPTQMLRQSFLILRSLMGFLDLSLLPSAIFYLKKPDCERMLWKHFIWEQIIVFHVGTEVQFLLPWYPPAPPPPTTLRLPCYPPAPPPPRLAVVIWSPGMLWKSIIFNISLVSASTSMTS